MARPRIYEEGCTCKIEGCEKQAKARGMCSAHYQKFWKAGKVTPLSYREKKGCSVEGCEKAATKRGMCDMHYQRWKKYGDPHVEIKGRKRLHEIGQHCSVDGCEEQAKVKGLCQYHYSRLLNNGDPVKPTAFELRPRVCIVEGCDNPVEGKGLCEKHAGRMRRNGMLDALGSSDGRPRRFYIPGVVDAPSITQGLKEVFGYVNSRVILDAKREGISPERVVVRRWVARAELLARKLDTALDKLKKDRERAERKARFEIWGEFSCIALCSHCGKFYEFKSSHPTAYVENRQRHEKNKQLCSKECQKESARSQRRSFRRKRRQEGKYDRGKHIKRARKYGVAWEEGITARAVAERDNMTCAICWCRVEPHTGQGWQPNGWTVGHIVPLSDLNGPGHVWSNVQCECHECNTHRGTMTVSEFLQELERERKYRKRRGAQQ